jgi:hypothetical protein
MITTKADSSLFEYDTGGVEHAVIRIAALKNKQRIMDIIIASLKNNKALVDIVSTRAND